MIWVLCSLHRRAGQSLQAIKILQPLVYPKARSAAVATAEERLEYGSCLVRLGITAEAERIFNTIDVEQYPIVLIRKSFLKISGWDYLASNEYLLNYINHPKADYYNKLIAQVNLLQGYVNLEMILPAENLFRQLIGLLNLDQYKLLLAAVYEFGAEICRLKKDYKNGVFYIDEAKKLLKDSDSIDSFLIKKQELLLQAYSGFEFESVNQFKNLKKEALLRKHFESIRDLDFHLAALSLNHSKVNKIYWGTASEFYKKRIENYCLNRNLLLDKESHKFGKNKGLVFDIKSGTFSHTDIQFKSNQAMARLFRFLTSESYKPVSVMDIFNAVYSNEVFIPDYSEDKVHQLLKRFRSFLVRNKIPIVLICNNDYYKLSFSGDFSLIKSDKTYSADYLKIQSQFKNKKFTNADPMALFKCSWRTAMRKIAELKKLSLVEAKGKTRNVYYILTN